MEVAPHETWPPGHDRVTFLFHGHIVTLYFKSDSNDYIRYVSHLNKLRDLAEDTEQEFDTNERWEQWLFVVKGFCRIWGADHLPMDMREKQESVERRLGLEITVFSTPPGNGPHVSFW